MALQVHHHACMSMQEPFLAVVVKQTYSNTFESADY